MTYREWTRSTPPIDLGFYSATVRSSDYYLNSGNSPRNSKGKLELVPNVLTYRYDRLTRYRVYLGGRDTIGFDLGYAPPAASQTRFNALPPSFTWASQDNQANARFMGKLRYGSASLGMTIATWKQSQAMMSKRFKDVQRALDRGYSRLSKDPKLVNRLRKEKEPLANQVLEVEFGWRPVIQDITAALTTVCEHAVPNRYVKGVGKANWDETTVYDPLNWIHWIGYSRVTYCATVEISNPNLWLANRMGLLNLPAIIWDAIPWSFVVAMFGNFNQLIGSLVDEVGLNITDRSVTRSVKMVTEQSTGAPSLQPMPQTTSSMLWKEKQRTLGYAPPLTFVAKVPDINWELVLIASSLVMQKIERINKLIRLV